MFNLFPVKKSVDDLLKQVNNLNHLNSENIELMMRLQIVQNDYKKCAEQRDEFKHQLNAANKENEKLKKDIIDYVFEKDNKIEQLQKELNHMKAVAESAISLSDLSDKVDYDLAKDEIKKSQDWNKVLYGVEVKTEQVHPLYPLHWGGYDKEVEANNLETRVKKLEKQVKELTLIKVCQKQS